LSAQAPKGYLSVGSRRPIKSVSVGKSGDIPRQFSRHDVFLTNYNHPTTTSSSKCFFEPHRMRWVDGMGQPLRLQRPWARFDGWKTRLVPTALSGQAAPCAGVKPRTEFHQRCFFTVWSERGEFHIGAADDFLDHHLVNRRYRRANHSLF
jgi:hypothetical protein